MATYQTFTQVGIKEDISDIITNISPTKTPFQAMIGNEKVHNVLFQWQEDSLRAAAANAAVQGADATDITVAPTVMRQNYTQILQETVKVAGTTDAVATYGRAKESAYQMAKSAAQVKRDFEYALVGSQQAASAGNSTTAAQMAGYQTQIDATQITYCGASTALDETHLLTALQAAYNAGAEPNTVMVVPSDSLLIAAFAKATGRYRTIQDNGNGSKSTVVNAVDFYVSPFGMVKIVLNRFQHVNDTLVFEPSMWVKATLRPWFRETLAKTGDALKMQLLGEFSLKHKNYKASALIVANATTGL